MPVYLHKSNTSEEIVLHPQRLQRDAPCMESGRRHFVNAARIAEGRKLQKQRPWHDCRVAVTLILPHMGTDRDTLMVIMVRPGATDRPVRLRSIALITKVGHSKFDHAHCLVDFYQVVHGACWASKVQGWFPYSRGSNMLGGLFIRLGGHLLRFCSQL